MKGKAMWIITNDRVTPKVYLHVVSCLPIPSGYCGNESLKFTLKMVRYTAEQRAKIVEFYFSCNSSIIAVQRSYRNIYNDGRSPNKNCIKAMVSKFKETGTTVDKRRCGRPRTVRTDVSIQAVSISVADRPTTSTRKRSTQLTMSRRSLQRILKEDLKYHPYKIQLTQELQLTDYQKRLDFAQTFLLLADAENFIANLIMTDEAHFYLNGDVNKQNCRIWASENPREIHEHPLHPVKVTVWCGITSSRIIGPYFFEDVDGNTVTVNGNRYRQMLQEYFFPEVEDMNTENIWFQQDGATAHTARETMDMLRMNFPQRVISRFGDVPWPPRSPDLSPLDFFLWGYLKGKVYIDKPNTLQELKLKIIQEISRITPDMLSAVMNSVIKRARLCLTNNGNHLKNIIFHT